MPFPKGYKQSTEHIRNRVEAMKGFKHSDKTKEKLSKWRHGRFGTDVERFLKKITISADSCWIWNGGVSSGYGMFKVDKKHVRAHRWYYFHLHPEADRSLTIDHLCKIKRCVNPSHMELVTIKENIIRSDGVAAINHRKMHCKYGHHLRGDNLYQEGSRRRCRACMHNRRIKYENKLKVLKGLGLPLKHQGHTTRLP